MSIYAVAGATIEAVLQAAETGKVGTYRVSIIDTPTSSYWLNPTTSGIVEVPTGSAVYAWTGTAPATVGAYTVVWDAGTNSQVLAVEDLIITQSGVQPSSPSGADLCTLSDVRQALELPASDTTRDTLIQSLITDLSRAIMREYDREFAPVTASATRRFQVPAGSLYLDLTPYDLRTVSTLTINPEANPGSTLTAVTDFQLMPVTSQQGPYQGIRFSNRLTSLHVSQTAQDYGYTLVDITGAWGFGAVPDDVKRACVIAVQSALRRDLTELAIAGIEEAQMIAPEGPATHAIPGASRRLLAPYRRTAGAF